MTGMGVLLTLCVDKSAAHIIHRIYTSHDSYMAVGATRKPPSRAITMIATDTTRHSAANHSPDSNEPSLPPDHYIFDCTGYSDSDSASEECDSPPVEHFSATLAAQRSLLKALILESAIGVHSIIIGFGYGMLSHNSLPSIRILGAALIFHQFFEGVSLGMAVMDASVSRRVASRFALVFAFTFPLGSVIGLLIGSTAAKYDDVSASRDGTSHSRNTFQEVQGVANALAAGTLIYTALVDMIPDEFSASHSHGGGRDYYSSGRGSNSTLQLGGMYVALCAGFGCMAMMAIWA